MLNFKKWILIFVVIIAIAFVGLVGFNVYINYRNHTFKRDREEERMKKQKEREDKEKLDKEIAELQKDALEGFSAKGKGSVLKAENINHLGMLEHSSITCQNCHACENCEQGEECLKMEPKLIFPRKVDEYIHNVLSSFTDFSNNGGQLTEGDGYNDNVTPFLKRYNAALYGAPGTGKTELVNELVHHLQDQFGDPHNEIKPLKKELIELEKALEQLRKQANAIGRKNPDEVTVEDKSINKKIDTQRKVISKKKEELNKLEEKYQVPPVFKIDGAKLQTAGEAMNQPNPEQKLIKIIRYLKKEAFVNCGGENSNKPYIVFVEEADQGKNVMTAGKNNLLEEYKNFLSTTEDKIGLKADAQDPNSIIIIATNNFDQIDPAVVRRGRLGEKLNFNWTPNLLEKYSSRGDSEWERVNWPKNDPGWQFTGNVNYEELYKLCSQFGYSKFADQFTCKTQSRLSKPDTVNKANQIIESYLKLSKDKEWKEAKEKELGKFPTGKKIMEKKKNSEEEEEVDEKICNWILHFLHTFHVYNNRQDLDSFSTANEIQPYNFGDAFATREAIWGIYRRIGEECKVLEVNNDLLANAGKQIAGIKDLMVEVNDVKNQFQEIQHKINEITNESNRVREHMNSSIQVLRSSIERISQNSGADMTGLNQRVANLESKMSSLSSSGSSNSSSSSGGSKKEVLKSLDKFLEEIRGNLSSMSSTEVFNKIINFYNSNTN